MIRYKIDVLEALKEKHFSIYKLQKDKLLSSSTITKIKNNDAMISMHSIDAICTMLDCQPGKLLEHVNENKPEEEKKPRKSRSKKTVEIIEEVPMNELLSADEPSKPQEETKESEEIKKWWLEEELEEPEEEPEKDSNSASKEEMKREIKRLLNKIPKGQRDMFTRTIHDLGFTLKESLTFLRLDYMIQAEIISRKMTLEKAIERQKEYDTQRAIFE